MAKGHIRYPGRFAGLTWLNNNKWSTLTCELLCDFCSMYSHLHIWPRPISTTWRAGGWLHIAVMGLPLAHARTTLPCWNVPWLRRLVAVLLPWRPGFDPMPALVGFVVEIVELWQGFLRVLRYPVPVSFNRCYVIVIGPGRDMWSPMLFELFRPRTELANFLRTRAQIAGNLRKNSVACANLSFPERYCCLFQWRLSPSYRLPTPANRQHR